MVIVVVDALEEGGQRLLLPGRHAVDAHADDRPLVDLAEVEAERRLVAERRGRPEQVLLLRDPDHEVVGVEAPLVLGLAVGVEVGRVDDVVAVRLVADGQRQVARRAALRRAEADQQLHVVRGLAQDVRDLVDVRGLRAADAAEVGGCRMRGEDDDAPPIAAHAICSRPMMRPPDHAPALPPAPTEITSRSVRRTPCSAPDSRSAARPAPRPAPADRGCARAPVFGKRVVSVDRAIQQLELLAQLGVTMRRQGLHQIFQHRAHPPHDLDAARAAMPDFGARQVHVVLPVRRAEDQPQLAGLVAELLAAQVPQPDHPQQAVQLVDGQHRRRRIVDGRRQRLDRDVDQDAEGEGRILLHRALGSEHDGLPQPTVVDGAGAAVQPVQRFVDRQKVAHLRDEFDDPVGLPSLLDQPRPDPPRAPPPGCRR